MLKMTLVIKETAQAPTQARGKWGQKTRERDWDIISRPNDTQQQNDWDALGREGEGQQSVKGLLRILWQTELCKDSQGLCCGSDHSVPVQQHHCPSKPVQLGWYQEMNPQLAPRKMTKFPAKTVVQNSENSCPVTSPQNKWTKSLKLVF